MNFLWHTLLTVLTAVGLWHQPNLMQVNVPLPTVGSLSASSDKQNQDGDQSVSAKQTTTDTWQSISLDNRFPPVHSFTYPLTFGIPVVSVVEDSAKNYLSITFPADKQGVKGLHLLLSTSTMDGTSLADFVDATEIVATAPQRQKREANLGGHLWIVESVNASSGLFYYTTEYKPGTALVVLITYPPFRQLTDNERHSFTAALDRIVSGMFSADTKTLQQ